MKAKWTVNYELVATLPPMKRLRYLFRRDAFFRYELPLYAIIWMACIIFFNNVPVAQ